MIGRAQGVGPKLALRIVTELKDKAPSMMLRMAARRAAMCMCWPRARPKPMPSPPWSSSAIRQGTAAEAVARAGQSLGEAPLDALIRESLRQLAR